MSRRRYLVAYDIRDDKRLRSIAVCTEAYGMSTVIRDDDVGVGWRH